MSLRSRLLSTTILRDAEKGTGTGGNDTTAGGTPPQLTKEQVDAFIASAGSMAAAVKELGEIAKQAKERQAPPQEGEEGEGEVIAEEGESEEELLANVETMTNRELVGLTVKLLSKQLKETLTPIEKRILAITQDNEVGKAVTDVKEAAAEFPDFWEWREEMKKITSEEGIKNVRRLYQLARQDNPKRAAEMDEKYKKKPDERVAGEGARRGFGGLTPGSGGGTSKPGKMTRDEAAAAAWDDIVQQFGTEVLNA